MVQPLLIAKSEKELFLLPQMANRHGLIAGATGTGKTVTLQVLAEQFQPIGVPVFMADVKGDLSGIAQAGRQQPQGRGAGQPAEARPNFQYQGLPGDLLGSSSASRATRCAPPSPTWGRCCSAGCCNLNDTQGGVLNLVFKIADDNGLLLLDLKDLRGHAAVRGRQRRRVHDRSTATSPPPASGPSSAACWTWRRRAADKLLRRAGPEPRRPACRPMPGARGMINILAADKLMQAPKLYATFLLWLLSELFERLPEVGDLDKPKLVFFFDEAHLLFNDAPDALLDKIEQVVRLIRSKGVGVYFVTQNPLDIPDKVLGQLGNRVQHALRAFTPRDQKAVKAAAETFRANPKLDVSHGHHRAGGGRGAGLLPGREGPAGDRGAGLHLPPRRPDRADHARRAAPDRPELGRLRPLREGRRPRVGLRDAESPRPENHQRRERIGRLRPRPDGSADSPRVC